jgi:hypothetical protein
VRLHGRPRVPRACRPRRESSCSRRLVYDPVYKTAPSTRRDRSDPSPGPGRRGSHVLALVDARVNALRRSTPRPYVRDTLPVDSGLRVSELALGTMTIGEDWGWVRVRMPARRSSTSTSTRAGTSSTPATATTGRAD